MYGDSGAPPVDPYTEAYSEPPPPAPGPDPRDRDLPPPRGRSRSRSPAAPNPSNVLGVFGLSIRTTERDLDDEFSRYGRVEKVVIVYDQRSDRSRGFGFITMSTTDEAGRCIKELNGVDLNGRRIRVDYSVTDRPHAPTPGMSDLMSLATAENVTPTAVMTGIVTRMAETTVTGVTVVARLRAVTPRTIEDAGATPEALPEAAARQGPGTTMPHPPAHCLPTESRRAGKDTGDCGLFLVKGGPQAGQVGKSSFVNSLLGKAALPTYKLSSSSPDGPTTTIYPQEVSLDVDGKQVRLIDTPGLAWQAVDESPGVRERSRARDILTRSRGRIERLKDPASVLAELVSRANKEDLMLFYNLPAFADGDANAFLSGVARSNGLIKKGGTLDLAGASRIVLRDWSTGKFPRYTVPLSTTPTSTSDPAFADAYTKDEELLSRLSTRKELRKGTGVVKLDAGEPEIRKVALDASWAGSADGGDESDNEDENEDEDELAGDVSIDLGEEESEDDEEGEGSDEGGDDEKEPSPPRGKRKRGVKAPAARPAKKVAFAPEPKSTKQARSAAGARPRAKAGGVASPTAASAKSKAKPTPPGKQVKETKSALKKTPASTPGKVANVSSKKASVAAAPATHGAGEAYDFKQLF
ncbi:predicted protein [Postia placenta Mad-698-R]|uniref:RRM domain-containing protein n=1 Tax=Postia placenta MAD-698-R-SB12 TaxID=670580 RepID=A0A1X6MW24_9APHY|nr:hypothetical protein POSPLADRAFT_1047979 [Postia placenta MAD-698-R-SB12]EED81127.1 predicted protein [Postia placenta Mad-698-R]OSX60568.1 hypothetical protein POSPLADRAFT_1047979 [Postia placenta MAD-698-R-SB12]